MLLLVPSALPFAAQLHGSLWKQPPHREPCQQIHRYQFRRQVPARSGTFLRLRPRRHSLETPTHTVLNEVFERLSLVEDKPLLDTGVAPAWSDALLMACALAMCAAFESCLGADVAGWAAVTTCMVTGLETDLRGRQALSKCYMRLAGTLLGAAVAALVGHSWTCMVAWTSILVIVKRRLNPRWSYACSVAALTYAVVGLGGTTGVEILSRGSNRLLGVLSGSGAVITCLMLRAICFMSWNFVGRRLQRVPSSMSVHNQLHMMSLHGSMPKADMVSVM